jgi:uncharacterized protein YggE
MNANGGRRIITLACCLTLAVLAASCSSDETPKKNADAPAAEPDVSIGGGSADSGSGSGGGLSSGGAFLSLDSSAGVLAGAGGASPGLSVRGTAAGTAPADLAFVVVVPAPRGASDFLTSGNISPEDRTAVVNAVAATGVPRGDVTFEPDLRTGQSRVQVKAAVNQVAAKGPGIVAAVEKVLGRSVSSGASFSVANCDPASAPLRKQALQQADAQAKALADAGKLTLGGIVAVRQDSDASPLRAAVPSTGCPLVAAGQLEAFDAKPEVKLNVGVSVTYALAGAPASGGPARPLLWALGSATAKAKADEAYVVVFFESDDSDPSGGPSTADRNKVFDALGKLKVDRKDITITSRSDYGVTTVVQVETKAAGLAAAGKDIVRAVEDVLGRSDSSGAKFASSSCPSLLAKARKDAVADGRKRAGALAEAAGVKLGDLQSVSEVSAAGIDPCDDSVDALLAAGDYGSSPLQPFDADPEVSLTTAAQLGFLIG